MRISRFLNTSIIAAASVEAAEFDFSTLGSLVADYDGRAGITTAGTGVSQWDDQSGNANHAVESDDPQRPSDGGAVNGFNALIFTGATDDTMRAGPATTNAMTVFVVGQVGATPYNNANSIIGSGASGVTVSGWHIRHQTSGAVFMMLSDGTSRVSTSSAVFNLAAGANFIVGIRYDLTNRGCRVNGGTENTGTQSFSTVGTNGINLAAEGSVSGGIANTHWDGELTRVLLFDERLNDTNFAAAFTELNSIYGVF